MVIAFFNDVEEHEFPLNCTTSFPNGGLDFFLQPPEFYSSIQFEIIKALVSLVDV